MSREVKKAVTGYVWHDSIPVNSAEQATLGYGKELPVSLCLGQAGEGSRERGHRAASLLGVLTIP